MVSNAKPIANPLIVLREEFDDWAILFDPDTGDAFGLNPIGVFIWKCLNGKHAPEDIREKVCMAYKNVPNDPDDNIDDHINEFIESLSKNGLADWQAMKCDAVKVMKTPKSVDLSITTRCNLRCSYCSYFTSAGDVAHDLPKEEWLKFFEELNRCAVMEVTLEGGEPFFRYDLKGIIEGIVQNRMRFSILSNGTMISDEMAEFIASTGRCNYVQVSIDGSTSTTHDACRGDGSFVQAIEGLKRLKKYKISAGVRVTIHKHNVEDLEEIAKLLLEDLKLSNFSTNAASYFGLCRYNKDEVQLTVRERSLAMESLLKLKKKYNGRISATAGPLADAKNWIEMENWRKEGKKSIPGRGYLTSCGGVMTKMAVRADGIMVPCAQMSHIELGQINKDNLRKVWNNHPELMKLRERHTIPLSNFEFCKGCEYLPYCTGNCPALAYTILGAENHPSPDGCFKRFLEQGGRLPNERC